MNNIHLHIDTHIHIHISIYQTYLYKGRRQTILYKIPDIYHVFILFCPPCIHLIHQNSKIVLKYLLVIRKIYKYRGLYKIILTPDKSFDELTSLMLILKLKNPIVYFLSIIYILINWWSDRSGSKDPVVQASGFQCFLWQRSGT